MRRLSLVGAAASVVAGCATPEPQRREPIPVEFRSGGDDGATQHLLVELEKAFTASGGFVQEAHEAPGAIIVRIPRHVEARGRNYDRIRYTVEFSSRQPDGSLKPLGSIRGRCKLGGCAPRVVREAERILARDG